MSFVSARGNLPLFEADGTVHTDDKVHLLALYSGILPVAYTMQPVVATYLGKQPP